MVTNDLIIRSGVDPAIPKVAFAALSAYENEENVFMAVLDTIIDNPPTYKDQLTKFDI